MVFITCRGGGREGEVVLAKVAVALAVGLGLALFLGSFPLV